MSDEHAARFTGRDGARTAASLRSRFGDEVAELVELVLVQPAARRTVDEVFETAASRLHVGVRPEDQRLWVLALARELALTQVRERPDLGVRPADGFELLPYERTLLHLYRRCGFGADELAASLSDEPERLAVLLAQLDRRFLDYLAVTVLVADGDSHCAAYNAIVEANHDRLEIGSFTRGHAHSCPDCRELIRARAETTDMLGRPTPIAVRPIPVFDRPTRRVARRRLGARTLAVGAAVAAIVATAALATGRNSPSDGSRQAGTADVVAGVSSPQTGSADVSPPSPVAWLSASGRRSVYSKPGVTVKWGAATDDVGVAGYEVFRDGSLKGQTVDRSFLVTGVECGQLVTIGVDAFDAAGNRSPITTTQASTGRCGTEPPPTTPTPTPSPPPASASGTYYVSPSGSDGNAGSSAAPFRTLQKAADVVGPGDVVLVRDGVYSGLTTSRNCGDKPIVCLARGGSPSADVVFKAEHRWAAVLDGGRGDVCTGIAFDTRASYVRVEGFEIRNIACDGSAGAVESFTGAHDIAIVGNNIHDIGRICTDTSDSQVGIYGKSSDVLVEGNWIHGIGRYAPDENGCNPSTEFYKNHDHGIYFDGTPSGLTIRNNIFETIKRGWAIQLWNGTISDVQIVHNTFVDGNPYQDGSFIVLWRGTHRKYAIRNNIFDRPVAAAIAVSSASVFADVLFDDNLVTNGAATNRGVPPGFWLGNRNLFGVEPVYVDRRDYHLTASSPGVDDGVDVGVKTDFDGDKRPVGRPDMGAYERQ